MHLFEGPEEQAIELARRVRGGARVTIADEQGKRALLTATAEHLGGDAVLVHVPRDLDRAAYTMLSAAAQCGAEALHRTAAQLAAHQSDPSSALEALDRALGNRPLLVEAPDILVGAPSDAEIRDVFKPSLLKVHEWIERRASVTVAHGDLEGIVHPRLGALSAGGSWNAALLWTRAAQDADRYTLAVARALLLGAATDDPALGWDTESIIGDLWQGMTRDLVDLVALLAVHGRPVARSLFERLGLVPAAVIDRAADAFLVEQSRGSLRLVAPAAWQDLLAPAARRDRHRRLGEAFAVVAREGSADDTAPLAVLEAHRHYAAVPDEESAREFSRFGVAMLLATAKRISLDGRYDALNYNRSARTYEMVLRLDDQVRAGNDTEGIGSRARAYALHYLAYNRYKARSRPDGPSPAETLATYREALTIWPQNALFWSRTIGCCFVAGRYEEGTRTRDEAFNKVPPHPQRAWLLIGRTVDHLLRRNLVLGAMLVWRDHRPATLVERDIERELLARLAGGWEERRLWARGATTLPLRTPTEVRITSEQREFHGHLLGLTRSGSSPEASFTAVVSALLGEFLGLLEDPELAPDRVERRQALIDRLDLEALRAGDANSRWIAYLASLDERVEAGEMTEAQRSMLLRLWRRATTAFPTLRRPAIGPTQDDQLHLSWSFADRRGVTLTIDLERDGRVDWFYRNAADGVVLGTKEGSEPDLPGEALPLLAAFAP